MLTLHLKLKNALRNQFFVAFSISQLILLSAICPLFLKLIIYFFPLLSTTAVCIVVVYMFILSEKQEAREVLLLHGEKSERGIILVYDEVNRSVYDHHAEACCYLLKSSELSENGWGEDSEKVIFAGKLDVGMESLGFFNEDATSCEVDRLAEGTWNCYFGKNSTWHYTQ